MLSHRDRGFPLLWRALVALAVALAAALALQAATAAAAPGTQTWTGQSSGSTPDISGSGFTFLDANGNVIPSMGIAGTLNFTLDGTPRVGYCIDTTARFSTATEPVDVTTTDAPDTAALRALTWILLNRTPSGAPTPAKQQQAALSQIATWLLVDTNINKTTPTTDPATNAAAHALVNEALAATATPSTLAISASAPAAGATSSTITITGKPGAQVFLSASGPGSLSAGQVTIGAGGTATVTLTAPGPGTTTVSASTAGDGRLMLINPTDPVREPQSTATAETSTLTASTSVTFQAAVTPVTPVTPSGGATVSLRITKTGPLRATVLTNVRYTIVVRNPGKTAAKNVVLKDRIPAGLSYVRSSIAGTLNSGVVTYQLGTIQPGKAKTVYVTLMAAADVRGTRTNVATVSATSVKQLTARAATIFRAVPRRVQPAVTG